MQDGASGSFDGPRDPFRRKFMREALIAAAGTALAACGPIPGESTKVQPVESPTLTSEQLVESFQQGEPEIVEATSENPQEMNQEEVLKQIEEMKGYVEEALDWIAALDPEAKLVTAENRQKILESVRIISKENWDKYFPWRPEERPGAVPLGKVEVYTQDIIGILFRTDLMSMDPVKRQAVCIHETVHALTMLNAGKILGSDQSQKPLVDKDRFLVNETLYFMDLRQGVGKVNLSNGEITFIAEGNEFPAVITDLVFQSKSGYAGEQLHDPYGLLNSPWEIELTKMIALMVGNGKNLSPVIASLAKSDYPIDSYLEIMSQWFGYVGIPVKDGFPQDKKMLGALDTLMDLVGGMDWINPTRGTVSGININSSTEEIAAALERFYDENNLKNKF